MHLQCQLLELGVPPAVPHKNEPLGRSSWLLRGMGGLARGTWGWG
jgi:hypothetical protein